MSNIKKEKTITLTLDEISQLSFVVKHEIDRLNDLYGDDIKSFPLTQHILSILITALPKLKV